MINDLVEDFKSKTGLNQRQIYLSRGCKWVSSQQEDQSWMTVIGQQEIWIGEGSKQLNEASG